MGVAAHIHRVGVRLDRPNTWVEQTRSDFFIILSLCLHLYLDVSASVYGCKLIRIFYIPSDSFWPSEDHEVELAIAIINQVAGVATLVEHGVFLPVGLVGGVAGHQLLDTGNIDLFAVEAVHTQFNMQETDKVVEVFGNRDRIFSSSRGRSGRGTINTAARGGDLLLTLGHDRSDERRQEGVARGQAGSLNGGHGGMEKKKVGSGVEAD